MDAIAIIAGIRMLLLLARELDFNVGGKVVSVDVSHLDTPEKVDKFIEELQASKHAWPKLTFKSPVASYEEQA